jgi:hypothetical protein
MIDEIKKIEKVTIQLTEFAIATRQLGLESLATKLTDMNVDLYSVMQALYAHSSTCGKHWVTGEQRDKIAEGIFEYRKMAGHPSWKDVDEKVKDFWREHVTKEFELFKEHGVLPSES